jgi:hypothetical protein
MEFEQAKALLGAFEREKVEYVLVGSMALAAQGLVRATRDMDVFVSPAPENVKRPKLALRSVFDDPHIDEIGSDDLSGDYPAMCYIPPEGDYSIDILARLGEAFRFEDIEWESVDLGHFKARVATPRMLYRMKRDTLRPQDRVDAEVLRRHFELSEE